MVYKLNLNFVTTENIEQITPLLECSRLSKKLEGLF